MPPWEKGQTLDSHYQFIFVVKRNFGHTCQTELSVSAPLMPFKK